MFDALENDDYEQMEIYKIYRVLGTLVSVLLGFGTLFYFALLQYRDTKQLHDSQAKATKKSMVDDEAKSLEMESLSR